MPFSIETIDELQKIDRNREKIEIRNREVRDLYEQISRHRTELINLIGKANNKLEMFRGFTASDVDSCFF